MRFPKTVTLLILGLALALPAHAEDGDSGWSSTAEFGLVMTSGNAESETISFKDETKKSWDKSSLTFKLGAIRAETTTTAPTAFGTPGSFTVESNESTSLSAESYYFEGRFDREITEKFFWFAGTGWDRNRPSGINSRVTAFGGVGNIWRDDEKVSFRTDYALSYTDEEFYPDTTLTNDYSGLRASWGYKHQFTESTTYFNDFVLDYGFDDSDNWRANMINAVAVAINDKMALKVSLQWLYNNLPPSDLIPLFDIAGPSPPAVQIDTVSVEKDELDTIFSAALVINF